MNDLMRSLTGGSLLRGFSTLYSSCTKKLAKPVPGVYVKKTTNQHDESINGIYETVLLNKAKLEIEMR